MKLQDKLQSFLFYGGIGKEAYLQVRESVAESNHKILMHWSVLVSLFWTYCLLMSLWAADYAQCRSAYAIALGACIVTYLCARFLVPKVPQALLPLMYFFRLSLFGGAIGIAVCHYDVRSITLFAIAIVSPSIFADNTMASLITHALALILYVALGSGTIAPEIYSWGLGNYLLFSVFGLLIGNAIDKERFERYVYERSANELAEMRMRLAYRDQMTGLKNRRAYSERMQELSEGMPKPYSVVIVDINGLKQLNDTQGHDAGDELIIATAVCLRTAFSQTEDIYRLGGDEFCVLLQADEATAQDCLATLERSAKAYRGEHVVGISLACGLASTNNAANIEAITQEADARMYEKKRTFYAIQGNDRRRR